MALPIWGLFMKKVFADPELHYSQSVKFQVPTDLDICDNDFIPSLGVGGVIEPVMETVTEHADDGGEAEPDSEFFD